MSQVHYRHFEGKLVSRPWYVVLTAARRAGVAFTLDDGHRTMAEQQAMVRLKGVYDPVRNPHGAAVPSPTAPHIKLGRIDHALDVNALDGGVHRLDMFVARHYEHLMQTVPSEAWHREILGGEAALRRLAAQLEDPLKGYTADERRWIREYDDLVRRHRRPRRRRALRRAMKRDRKRIWRAAQHYGWDHRNRRARYQSLRARTT